MFQINPETFNHKMTKKCSNIDDRCYQIQEKFDPDTYGGAADILATLNNANLSFIGFLENKYIKNSDGVEGMSNTEFQKRKTMAKNLKKRYNPSVLREHDPKGKTNTSYVWQKGKEIGYCLREKQTGNSNLHAIDILLFVNLHEVSHLAGTSYNPGHTVVFWKDFKIILEEAMESGLYHPVDYSYSPEQYCGLDIEYNPLFDPTL